MSPVSRSFLYYRSHTRFIHSLCSSVRPTVHLSQNYVWALCCLFMDWRTGWVWGKRKRGQVDRVGKVSVLSEWENAVYGGEGVGLQTFSVFLHAFVCVSLSLSLCVRERAFDHVMDNVYACANFAICLPYVDLWRSWAYIFIFVLLSSHTIRHTHIHTKKILAPLLYHSQPSWSRKRYVHPLISFSLSHSLSLLCCRCCSSPLHLLQPPLRMSVRAVRLTKTNLIDFQPITRRLSPPSVKRLRRPAGGVDLWRSEPTSVLVAWQLLVPKHVLYLLLFVVYTREI